MIQVRSLRSFGMMLGCGKALRTGMLCAAALTMAMMSASVDAQTPDAADPAAEAAQDDVTADETDAAAAAVTEADADRPAVPDVDEITELFTIVGPVFAETPWWGWGLLFTCILIGLIVGKIAQAFLRKSADRLKERGAEIRGTFLLDLATPVSLVCVTIGISVGFRFLSGLTPELQAFTNNVVKLLIIVALGWFVYNLVDLVDIGLRRVTKAETNKLTAQLLPLIRKALRIFVLIIFTLFIAQNVFDLNVTAWLAGLGIGGLAVALAAQDSIKNLFGSITVLLDKPFAVGDRIIFSGTDGFVEEIGLRSTKIRTFTGHVVTVPNMQFIDGTVENVSARPFIRRMMDVTIPYDTPAEKIAQAVQIIKDILHEGEMAEPFKLDERPPRVFFNDYNAASLNISVAYWYFLDEGEGRDWWGFLAYNDIFNHRLFKAFNEADIEFAFPTQTLHLAGDANRELSVRVLGDNGAAPREQSGATN